MSSIKKVKNPSTYIDNLSWSKGYENCITVEHRSHNPKRDFLFVNKYQCKHIPCSPTQMINMCKALAEKVNNSIDYKRILVVGFAETATAIAHIVASEIKHCEYIICTTREDIENSEEIITFEEEHSHATTQKLLTYKSNSHNINTFDYILFVEDEISTGNTILNFIKAFKNKFNNNFGFGVASICNLQSDDNIKIFNEYKIDRFYLISGSLKDTDIKMDIDNSIISEIFDATYELKSESALVISDKKYFSRYRLGIFVRTNRESFNDILNICADYESVRIIGSEECMIPAILIGSILEKEGKKVICHATTRSKIDIIHSDIDNETSGIKNGHKVISAYDNERNTYIYNTSDYTDLVIAVSDTPNIRQFIKFADSIATVCNNTKKVIGYKI